MCRSQFLWNHGDTCLFVPSLPLGDVGLIPVSKSRSSLRVECVMYAACLKLCRAQNGSRAMVNAVTSQHLQEKAVSLPPELISLRQEKP